MDYFSWTLCRKLILGGQMAPKGLKILQSQNECTCFKRNYMYAVLLHKQRSYSFCWPFTVHSDHGHTLSFKDLRRIMQRDQIPVLVCLFYSVMLLKKGFLFMSCSSLGKLLPPSSVFVFNLCICSLLSCSLAPLCMNYQHTRWECHILQSSQESPTLHYLKSTKLLTQSQAALFLHPFHAADNKNI